MNQKLYGIRDHKIAGYLPIFQARTRGEGLRMWTDWCNNPQMDFNKHPNDFELFELGEFDDEAGVFHNGNSPLSLGLAAQFIASRERSAHAEPLKKTLERYEGEEDK